MEDATESTQGDIGIKPLDESALLRVRNIRAGYGKITILHDINLDVRQGEIVCIIGPNGAGKSTAFKAVFGFVTVSSGQILFDGNAITNQTPQEVLRHGITFVPQGRSTFPQMTVEENLRLGLYLEPDEGRIQQAMQQVFEMFPRLKERRKQLAGTMSGGEQRMLEIGRALMSDPRLLMLDEPSAGLAPVISKQVFATVRHLNEELGVTVFMVEQNARQGLAISDRGYVLEAGRNRFEGTGAALINNDVVQRMYLGAH
jgi:ABC-type branched-subunit amino acid transport system ATPase component